MADDFINCRKETRKYEKDIPIDHEELRKKIPVENNITSIKTVNERKI